MRLGLREANQQFSKAMKAVKSGEEVVLTERGKPIAVIRPLTEDVGERALRRMEAAGLVWRASKRAPRRFKPIRIKGKPISETIREQHDAE